MDGQVANQDSSVAFLRGIPFDELKVILGDEQQFKRFRKLMRDVSGRSWLGHWAHSSSSERTLVLFTLGIVVGGIVLGVLLLVGFGHPTEGTVTALSTLAGTGLGFVGGMVKREAPEERSTTTSVGAPTSPTEPTPSTESRAIITAPTAR